MPPPRRRRAWRTPVTVANLGEPWKAVVSAGKAVVVADAVARNCPVLNAGQTGYFRSAYSPELWACAVGMFDKLAPDDQLGLIYDSRALGEAGYAPLPDFLAVALKAQDARDSVVLATLAHQLAALDDLYKGSPAKRLSAPSPAPAYSRPSRASAGTRSPGRPTTTPSCVARSWAPSAGSTTPPSSPRPAGASPPGCRPRQPDRVRRQAVLSVIAAHADAATWTNSTRWARRPPTSPTRHASTPTSVPVMTRRWPIGRWRSR